MDPAKLNLRSLARATVAWLAFGACAAVMCEVGARLDDWFFEGIPVQSSPSFPALFANDETGMRHGIPGARWKKVQLNNLGLRGPDVPEKRTENCERWMFLGASETFGDPAQSNREYPARVRALTPAGRCREVLNTAFPAFDVRAITRYYRFYMARYSPDVVFIYPPTHFYLGTVNPPNLQPPSPSSVSHAERSPTLLEQSRFFERLKDTAEVPAFIQKRRVQRWIEEQEKGHDAEWHFTTVPQDRLDMLADDLRVLIDLIRENGAEPVLITHAVRVSNPPREEDLAELNGMRVYIPRATDTVIAAFEYAAAERVRLLGSQTHTRVIDVARVMNGRRDRFVDLVHFSNEGNAEVGQLIERAMDGK